MSTSKVVPDKIAAIVGGIAEGCVQAGCALTGGETAEHPGLMEPDEYDVSGTGVGVVNADAVLGPDRVAAGDVLIAMGSSGLHSNGYSLVRHVLLEQAGLDLADRPEVLGGRTLGDELLTPTRIYALDCLELAGSVGVRTFAHVTGGGLAANLARVLPAGVEGVVDRAAWAPPPVFRLLADCGVDRPEAEQAFNLGVGMVAVVAPDRASAALDLLTARDVPAWVLGDVRATSMSDAADVRADVRLVGDYAGHVVPGRSA